jgi:DNA-binding IclR family transcriptional regulator
MSVQSLDRAFDILELLSKEQHGLSITDISKKLDLHKSTVFRLLNSLKNRSYIQQNSETLKYSIGYEFIELSSLYLNNLELKTEAEPILRKLSQKTTQTVFLAIMQDHQVMYIDKVEQFNSLRKYSIIGTKSPLHCTALGKSLLLGMSEKEIKGFYKKYDFEVFTKKTIKDINKLLEDLKISKERGWTYDDEENEEGVNCLAAPIFDYRSNVIAAVSASWNIKATLPVTKENMITYVIKAAQEISINMGYRSYN